MNERHGGAAPADVQDRIAAEERHIFGSGHVTILAIAAKLAELSESRGCPVGFRGLPGVLLEALDAAEYLYPRGQCADYMYWALALLRHQTREAAV